MIDDVVAVVKRWRHSGAVRLTRSGYRKNCRVHVRGRGWGRQRYLPPRLRGDMATPTAIALDSSFNLLLISRILVGTNGNGRHHVIIGLGPRDRLARRDNTLGSWCQQHTPIHDKSLDLLSRTADGITGHAKRGIGLKKIHMETNRILTHSQTNLACNNFTWLTWDSAIPCSPLGQLLSHELCHL